MNNTQITQIALEQSANDCNCNPADFTAGENRFFPSSVSDKAKRYLELPHILWFQYCNYSAGTPASRITAGYQPHASYRTLL